MNAGILRQLWSVVEETQTQRLLKLDDTELTTQLLLQLQHRYTLSSEETQRVQLYLRDRLSLIRDMAQV